MHPIAILILLGIIFCAGMVMRWMFVEANRNKEKIREPIKKKADGKKLHDKGEDQTRIESPSRKDGGFLGLGKKQYKDKEYEKALEYFKEAAEQGDAIAQFFIGQMYDEGIGTPQDYKQALSWYTKAAEHGDASAQWRLGTMFRDGEGVAEDNKRSAYWFNKARAQKDTGDKSLW